MCNSKKFCIVQHGMDRLDRAEVSHQPIIFHLGLFATSYRMSPCQIWVVVLNFKGFILRGHGTQEKMG